jgi:hypothetical protein
VSLVSAEPTLPRAPSTSTSRSARRLAAAGAVVIVSRSAAVTWEWWRSSSCSPVSRASRGSGSGSSQCAVPMQRSTRRRSCGVDSVSAAARSEGLSGGGPSGRAGANGELGLRQLGPAIASIAAASSRLPTPPTLLLSSLSSSLVMLSAKHAQSTPSPHAPPPQPVTIAATPTPGAYALLGPAEEDDAAAVAPGAAAPRRATAGHTPTLQLKSDDGADPRRAASGPGAATHTSRASRHVSDAGSSAGCSSSGASLDHTSHW